MRKILWAAAMVAVAGALASCDPKVLSVTDYSELKSISIEMSNDAAKWEFGETRVFTIAVNPATAICERFDIEVSNPEIVIVRQGELPNQFRLTANGEGKLIVTATAVGHVAALGEDVPVEKTAVEEFTLVDNRVKPTRPVVEVVVAPGTDLKATKVLAEDTAFVTDDGLELVLNVSSDETRATYSLKAEVTKVMQIERTGSESWMLRAAKPGRTWLYLTVTDGYGNAFEYAYLVYVFGHLTMTAEFIPMSGDAGFSVSEHSYSGLTAQLYMAGELFGWPWNDADDIKSVALPAYTGTLDISSQFVHDELMNYREQLDYLSGMHTGPDYNPAPYTPHRAKLNYIVTLSDPYIVIDTLVDDNGMEKPRWWEFWTEGALQQNGIAKMEQPDEILRDAQNRRSEREQNELVRSAEPQGGKQPKAVNDNGSVAGWQDGGEYVIPL